MVWTILKIALLIYLACMGFGFIIIVIQKLKEISHKIDTTNAKKSAAALIPELNKQLFEECMSSSLTKEIVEQIKQCCNGLPYEVTVSDNYVEARGKYGSCSYDFLSNGVMPLSTIDFKCKKRITPELERFIQWNHGSNFDTSRLFDDKRYKYVKDPVLANVDTVIRVTSVFADAIGNLLSAPDSSLYELVESNIEYYGDGYPFYKGEKPVTLKLKPTRGI